MDIEVEKIGSVAPHWWDDRVRASAGGHYYQSSLYARFLQSYQQSTPTFWCARQDGQPVALLLSRIERGSIASLLLRYVVWESGPVILCETDAGAAACAILSAVNSHARRRACVGLGPIKPAYHHEAVAGDSRAAYLEAGFRASDGATFLIDGRKGEQDCWKSLSSSARKSVRKAEKRGVGVQIVESGKMTSEIVEVYNQCRRRQNLPVLKSSYAPAFDEIFDGEALFFLAYHQERIIALLGCVVFGSVMIEFMAGQTEVDIKESLGGNDMIRWRVIQHAVANALVYDQSGVATVPRNPKEVGIRRFKEKWGGEYVPYSVWSKGCHSFLGLRR